MFMLSNYFEFDFDDDGPCDGGGGGGTIENDDKLKKSFFISFGEITPDWTALVGPTRCALSVPFKLSPKSLARLERI